MMIARKKLKNYEIELFQVNKLKDLLIAIFKIKG